MYGALKSTMVKLESAMQRVKDLKVAMNVA
jgi:hypothetical protein